MYCALVVCPCHQLDWARGSSESPLKRLPWAVRPFTHSRTTPQQLPSALLSDNHLQEMDLISVLSIIFALITICIGVLPLFLRLRQRLSKRRHGAFTTGATAAPQKPQTDFESCISSSILAPTTAPPFLHIGDAAPQAPNTPSCGTAAGFVARRLTLNVSVDLTEVLHTKATAPS